MEQELRYLDANFFFSKFWKQSKAIALENFQFLVKIESHIIDQNYSTYNTARWAHSRHERISGRSSVVFKMEAVLYVPVASLKMGSGHEKKNQP